MMRALLWVMPLMSLGVQAAEAKSKAEDCNQFDAFYRSLPNDNTPSETYRRLEFLGDSFTSGPLRISGYVEGQLAWSLDGTFGCSNGAVMCSLSIPLGGESAVDAVYEVFDGPDGSNYIVVPALGQSVYRYTFSIGPIADQQWHNGFTAEDMEYGAVPSNVYYKAGCNLDAG